MKPYRVAIVGSGSAGPAAGIFLARAGHEVTLFEQAEEERAVGAGFLLQPTGLAVLQELGLASEVVSKAQRVESLYCETTSGRILLNLHYGDLGEGLFGLGTHRSTFLGILLEAYREEGGKIRWGMKVTRMIREAEGWHLTSSHDHRVGPFDLVLLCDGARSRLREHSGIPHRVALYPWGALWFIGRRTDEFDPETLWQKVGSTRELCGFLPTGTDEDLLSLFWSARLDEAVPDLASWKDKVVGLVPQAAGFLEQIDSTSQFQRAAYHDVRMKQWHGDGLAVLGDAGHALSPQLGQGVNLALVDALVLSRCLARFDLEEALQSFSRQRRHHIRFYQFATRWTTPVFQSDFEWLGPFRNALFPAAMKIPYLRREMVLTMAGLKAGPFRRFVM